MQMVHVLPHNNIQRWDFCWLNPMVICYMAQQLCWLLARTLAAMQGTGVALLRRQRYSSYIGDIELVSGYIDVANTFEALTPSVSYDYDCGLEPIVVKQELVSRTLASPRQCFLLSSTTWSSSAVFGMIVVKNTFIHHIRTPIEELARPRRRTKSCPDRMTDEPELSLEEQEPTEEQELEPTEEQEPTQEQEPTEEQYGRARSSRAGKRLKNGRAKHRKAVEKSKTEEQDQERPCCDAGHGQPPAAAPTEEPEEPKEELRPRKGHNGKIKRYNKRHPNGAEAVQPAVQQDEPDERWRVPLKRVDLAARKALFIEKCVKAGEQLQQSEALRVNCKQISGFEVLTVQEGHDVRTCQEECGARLDELNQSYTRVIGRAQAIHFQRLSLTVQLNSIEASIKEHDKAMSDLCNDALFVELVGNQLATCVTDGPFMASVTALGHSHVSQGEKVTVTIEHHKSQSVIVDQVESMACIAKTRTNDFKERLIEAVNLAGKATSAPLGLVKTWAPAVERLVVELERNIRGLDEYMDLFDEYVSQANDSNTALELHFGQLEESAEKLRISHDMMIPSIFR
jgi:hypothetical protein